MDLKSFSKLATVSALALGLSTYAGEASAALVQSGAPNTVLVKATILNTIHVVATDLSFGSIGAIGKAADTATSTVVPGTVVLSADTGGGVGTNARIAPDPVNPPLTASVTLTGFANTTIYVNYAVTADMSSGGQKFWLVHLKDNLDLPDTGTGGVATNFGTGANGDPGPVTNQGHAVTSNPAGTLAFHIGGTFSTEAVDEVYTNATYNGSFTVTLSY